ncbi:MAG TPA: hypothetical protein VGM54_16160 [Chthoniobacter sp.]|jgi:hypothetical protein
MAWRNPITRFLCWLLVIYTVLALPWPGLSKAYGNYFRAICRLAFTADDGRRELSFETPGESSPRPNDTRVVIVNKALMHPDGSGPVRNLDVNFGWQSMALLVALILATPISWARRRWALLWGLLAIHVFLLLFLSFCIFGESAEISLVTLSPFWRTVISGCREAVASQLNLAVPILLWILVTFRREDRLTLPLASVLVAKESRG